MVRIRIHNTAQDLVWISSNCLLSYFHAFLLVAVKYGYIYFDMTTVPVPYGTRTYKTRFADPDPERIRIHLSC